MVGIVDFSMISAIMFTFIGFAFLEIGLVLHFEPQNAGILSIIAGIIVISINLYYFYLLKIICDSSTHKKKL
jgi:hypothetical protein